VEVGCRRPAQTAGVPVALGADDPLLFGSRLLAQYEIARDVHGLDDAALAKLARDSVMSSAAPADLKASMIAGIADWVADPASLSP
jgi:adenosine deaminase